MKWICHPSAEYLNGFISSSFGGHQRMRHTVKLILFRGTPLFFGLWTFSSFLSGISWLCREMKLCYPNNQSGTCHFQHKANSNETCQTLLCLNFYLLHIIKLRQLFPSRRGFSFIKTEKLINVKNMNWLGKYFEKLSEWARIIPKCFNTPIANNIIEGRGEERSERRGEEENFQTFHKNTWQTTVGMGYSEQSKINLTSIMWH